MGGIRDDVKKQNKKQNNLPPCALDDNHSGGPRVLMIVHMFGSCVKSCDCHGDGSISDRQC